ncbi:MAG: hypothetical protein AAF628_30180 [Planctomycetota bacterium]
MTVDRTGHQWRPPAEPLLHPQLSLGMSASSTLIAVEAKRSLSKDVDAVWYRLGLTVDDPQRSYPGAMGSSDLVEGFLDRRTGRVALTANAAAFNTPVPEGRLSISRGGRIATFDARYGPRWASRANPSQPQGPPAGFATSTRIVGIPGTGVFSAGFVDGVLFREGGVDRCAFISPTGDLVAGEFHSGVVSSISTRVTRSTASTTFVRLHSPTPVNDTDGEPLAWVVGVSQFFSVKSDTYFVPDVDEALGPGINRPVPVWDSPGIQIPGSTVGASGTVWAGWQVQLFGERATPRRIDLVAHNGGVLVPGGLARVRVWVPDSGSYLAGVLLGTTPASFPLGFTLGNALGSAAAGRPPGILGVVPLTALAAPAGGGGVTFALPVPRRLSPGLGQFLLTQSFAVDLGSGQSYLGNTAYMGTR